MNKFEDSLKVNFVPKIQKTNEHKKATEYEENIKNRIFKAIVDTPENSKEERMSKLDYMMKFQKILDNFEELEPVLNKYFRDKER